jgi:hypothetical protein
MSTSSSPIGSSPAGSSTALPATSALSDVRTSQWRRAALLLTGAAQLITIASLTYLLHPGVSWAGLLLAIAPVPLVALTAYAPRPIAKWAVIIPIVVVAAGLAGWITHAGWLFVPALAALIVLCLRLQDSRV